MKQQTVPSIDFNHFTLDQISDLMNSGKIKINKDYQRGDVWKPRQKVDLIRSMVNSYSIGVLVLFINDDRQYEILDGQQRLLAIAQYVDDKIDLEQTDIPKYSELDRREKTKLNAYCVFYIKLKSHDQETKEEDIVQTFLRLQEGTPLNKAEKISAYRGLFKDTFREVSETHPFFERLGSDKRFRWRQLAAEMLLIELEGKFEKKQFPNLDLESLVEALRKYEKTIIKGRVKNFTTNLDFLYSSLNPILNAFTAREAIAFYLLISYLRKHKAGNDNLQNELFEFAREFLKNLNMFSIDDIDPPDGMVPETFNQYKKFKLESKKLTFAESLESRLEIMLNEFRRLHPFITKDPKRLHDAEQKRILFFRQKGLCSECGKELNFKISSAHHAIAHHVGGRTDDLENSFLLHEKCHAKLEKRLRKQSAK